MSKKNITIITAIIFLFVIILGIRFLSGEDNWMCQNGEWVKYGNPRAAQPNFPCSSSLQNENSDIIINSPQINEEVANPIRISGEARGTWFFEAVFPVRLLNSAGEEIVAGYVEATSDWMTEDLVPFEGELNFIATVREKATLVLEKDNPSDLPENYVKVELPLTILPTDNMPVKVFFNNDILDPEISCTKVFSVERTIVKTQAVARAAVEELLKGPTEGEKTLGYITNINPGVEIKKITIDDGVATIDFNEQLEYQVAGSCRVLAIRQQIVETLKQFTTISEVIISINGRTEDIIQP